MIFTERPGRVRVFENGKLRPQPLFTVPDVEPKGESGLMSVALHPQFAANHLLYLSYAYNTGGQLVRVVRYRETPNGFTDRKVIIENIPAAQFHAGCRLRFGPDGKLYITTGDATQRELAQQTGFAGGKDSALERRRHGAERQSIRRPSERAARDLDLRAIATRKASTGSRARISCGRLNMGRAASTDRAAATKSTSSSAERITAGR